MKYYEDKLNMLKGGIPQQIQNSGEVSQDYYNPFDEGIAKAITSSRANMGMTQDQEHAALRNSMLAMANSLRQNPLQRKGSVIDNFRTGINALAPAIATYDQTENASLAQNNALAQQILAHKERQEQVTVQEEERLWHRQHAENQLAENKRHHNLLERFKKNKNSDTEGNSSLAERKYKDEQKKEGKSIDDLEKTLTTAEKTITKVGDKGFRGRSAHILDKFVPGGYRLSKEQAEINTLGDILRGKLFNSWGYRNQAEFEHVPSISASNPPEVNLAIIQKLKGLLLEKEDGAADIVKPIQTSTLPVQTIPEKPTENIGALDNRVLMYDPQTGEKDYISAQRLNEALKDGLLLVE